MGLEVAKTYSYETLIGYKEEKVRKPINKIELNSLKYGKLEDIASRYYKAYEGKDVSQLPKVPNTLTKYTGGIRDYRFMCYKFNNKADSATEDFIVVALYDDEHLDWCIEYGKTEIIPANLVIITFGVLYVYDTYTNNIEVYSTEDIENNNIQIKTSETNGILVYERSTFSSKKLTPSYIMTEIPLAEKDYRNIDVHSIMTLFQSKRNVPGNLNHYMAYTCLNVIKILLHSIHDKEYVDNLFKNTDTDFKELNKIKFLADGDNKAVTSRGGQRYKRILNDRKFELEIRGYNNVVGEVSLQDVNEAIKGILQAKTGKINRISTEVGLELDKITELESTRIEIPITVGVHEETLQLDTWLVKNDGVITTILKIGKDFYMLNRYGGFVVMTRYIYYTQKQREKLYGLDAGYIGEVLYREHVAFVNENDVTLRFYGLRYKDTVDNKVKLEIKMDMYNKTNTETFIGPVYNLEYLGKHSDYYEEGVFYEPSTKSGMGEYVEPNIIGPYDLFTNQEPGVETVTNHNHLETIELKVFKLKPNTDVDECVSDIYMLNEYRKEVDNVIGNLDDITKDEYPKYLDKGYESKTRSKVPELKVDKNRKREHRVKQEITRQPKETRIKDGDKVKLVKPEGKIVKPMYQIDYLDNNLETVVDYTKLKPTKAEYTQGIKGSIPEKEVPTEMDFMMLSQIYNLATGTVVEHINQPYTISSLEQANSLIRGYEDIHNEDFTNYTTNMHYMFTTEYLECVVIVSNKNVSLFATDGNYTLFRDFDVVTKLPKEFIVYKGEPERIKLKYTLRGTDVQVEPEIINSNILGLVDLTRSENYQQDVTELVTRYNIPIYDVNNAIYIAQQIATII